MANTHYVDGGLSDNLPVLCLINVLSAPIFAVFPEEIQEYSGVDNLFRYMMSLFSASIDNNVQRAKDSISKAFHIPIKTSFSTFDFIKAIELLGNERWYNDVRDDTEMKLKDFANNYGGVYDRNRIRFTDTNTKREYAEALERMSRDYDVYATHILSKMTVTINCDALLSESSILTYRPADSITKTTRLKIGNAKFAYYRSSVIKDGKETIPSIWQVKNVSTKVYIPFVVLALDLPIKDTQSMGCLIEFIDPEKSISVGDEIDISSTYYQKDGFTKINMGKSDFISVQNPHNYTIPLAEMVVFYPRSLGEMQMNYDSSKGTVPKERTEAFVPGELTYGGEKMGSVGFRCRDLEPGSRFYCNVTPIN